MSDENTARYAVQRKVSASRTSWIDVFRIKDPGYELAMNSPEFDNEAGLDGVTRLFKALKDGTVLRVSEAEYDAGRALPVPYTHSFCVCKHLGEKPYGFKLSDAEYYPILVSGDWHRTEDEAAAVLADFTDALKAGGVKILF